MGFYEFACSGFNGGSIETTGVGVLNMLAEGTKIHITVQCSSQRVTIYNITFW